MNLNKILLFAAVGGGAYYLLNNYANRIIGNIEQEFDQIKWHGVKKMQGNFSVVYKIKNKNPETLKVFGFTGQLTWQNVPLANIATTYEKEPLVLATGVQKEFIMYFNVPIVDFVADLAKLLVGQKPPVGANNEGFYVKGMLDAGLNDIKGQIPYSQHLTLADYGF